MIPPPRIAIVMAVPAPVLDEAAVLSALLKLDLGRALFDRLERDVDGPELRTDPTFAKSGEMLFAHASDVRHQFLVTGLGIGPGSAGPTPAPGLRQMDLSHRNFSEEQQQRGKHRMHDACLVVLLKVGKGLHQ